MFISKVMTRNPVTINQGADISQAQEKMSKHHFRHLPVVDENNFLIGMVTDRDIRSALPSSYLTDDDSREEWQLINSFKKITLSVCFKVKNTRMVTTTSRKQLALKESPNA